MVTTFSHLTTWSCLFSWLWDLASFMTQATWLRFSRSLVLILLLGIPLKESGIPFGVYKDRPSEDYSLRWALCWTLVASPAYDMFQQHDLSVVTQRLARVVITPANLRWCLRSRPRSWQTQLGRRIPGHVTYWSSRATRQDSTSS